MADYPNWVLAHKKKGTYINCVKGKYYLYAAHSERIPGTNKVRRVSDGYIGRITEEDGLIPAKDKVAGGVVVHEYGLCMAMLEICKPAAKKMEREFRTSTDKVVVAAVLYAAYGSSNNDNYHWSYLSVKYPNLNVEHLTDLQRSGADRMARQIADLMHRQFGDAVGEAKARLSRVCAVIANERTYISTNRENVKTWLLAYGVKWSDLYGNEEPDKDSGNIYSNQGLRKKAWDRPPAKRGRPKKNSP